MTYKLVQHDDHQPAAGQPHAGRRLRERRRRRRRRRAQRTIAVLPTLFTLGNLLCGFGAVFLASRDASTTTLPYQWTPLTYAALLIFAGMVFDGLDGYIARLTRSTSELGEQLDSMADMVTFGVAPAFITLQLIRIQAPFLGTLENPYYQRFAVAVAFIYVACAGLRLARFNIEVKHPTQVDHMAFSGLPTPGAAGTVASMALLHEHFFADDNTWAWVMTAAQIGIVLVTLLTALAMVSRLRYVHVMNRYIRKRAPFEYVVGLVVIGLLAWVHFQVSLATVLTVYALSAPGSALLRKLRRRSARQPTASSASSKPATGESKPDQPDVPTGTSG